MLHWPVQSESVALSTGRCLLHPESILLPIGSWPEQPQLKPLHTGICPVQVQSTSAHWDLTSITFFASACLRVTGGCCCVFASPSGFPGDLWVPTHAFVTTGLFQTAMCTLGVQYMMQS